MPIDTKCPTCEKPYHLADDQRGKRVRCRHCAEIFLVPSRGGDAPATVAEPADALPVSPREEETSPARDRREERPRPRKGKSRDSGPPLALILSLAIGIPVLLLIVVVSMFALSFSSRPARPPVAAQNPLIDFGQGRQDVVRNAIPLPPPPVGVPGKPSIDLIALIDPKRDALENRRWTVFNKALHCNDGSFVPRIEIPYQPPQEYDFIVTFSQPGLRNGISLIMPNPNGGSFFWYLGSEDGAAFGFAGNPNKGSRRPGLIRTNTAYTTTVQVRRDGVRGLVDGQELVRHQTDFRDLTCDDWRKIRDTRLLALACDDPTVFHHVRLVEISGAGRRAR